MYGGGSQLDPRDSIDTTPLSILEAQKELTNRLEEETIQNRSIWRKVPNRYFTIF